MGDEIENTSGTGTPGDPPAGAPPTGDTQNAQPVPPVEDPPANENWEERFKGLQPVHQKLVESSNALKAEYGTAQVTWGDEKASMQLQIDQLTTERDTLKTSSTGLGETNEKLEQSIESLNAQIARNQLIMSEYPDLALFEARGLIAKELTGDDLTNALNDLRSLMKSKAVDVEAGRMAGSTGAEAGATGGRGEAKGVTDIGEQLMKAQREGDADEISRLSALLIKTAEVEVFSQE